MSEPYWEPLAAAPVPDRLGINAVATTDWNAATEIGWYHSTPGANAPAAFTGTLTIGRVERAGGFITQTVWQYALGNASYATKYERRYDGNWGPWLLPSEISYTQITAAVSVTPTTVGTAVVVVTAPAFVADGVSPILIEFFAPFLRTPPAVGHAIYLSLWLDGAVVTTMTALATPAASPLDAPGYFQRRLVPAAGSRTYAVRAHVSGGGTASVGAGDGGAASFAPAFLRLSRAA